MSTVAGDLETIEPPKVLGTHTIAECDAVLARRPVGEVVDAWLDERLLAMGAESTDGRPEGWGPAQRP